MGRKVTRQPMPWLRPRLRAVNATASDLARHLDLPPVRVYEMINGKRKFQPGETEKTASFLKISEDQLVALIEGRIDADDVSIGEVSAIPWTNDTGQTALLMRATISSHGFWTLHVQGDWDEKIHPMLAVFPSTAFAIVVQDERNNPVYRARDCILIDPNLPVSPGDDVVLSSVTSLDSTHLPKVVAGQLTKMSETAWSLKQYAIGTERVFSRLRLPAAWRIVSRFSPVPNLSQQ